MAGNERKIVQIDANKCNGCGLCVAACHESAIEIVEGKARLVADVYCDGLGDCLSPCPTGAITIVTRTTEQYDEKAVAERLAGKSQTAASPSGCPGSLSRFLKNAAPGKASPSSSRSQEEDAPLVSELMNWPVQLRLVPASAPYLRGADILLAADCTAFAAPDFHRRYLKNKPVVIACPKLEDQAPQIAKLAELIKTAQPASLTVLRMEVPCCGGLQRTAEQALALAEMDGLPLKTTIIGIDGNARD